uniref:TIL domain-containing protein n=1 Tax=Monopterus albus TaxID=43700 RepID=A0A3Q3IU91_MONAL
MEVGPAGVPASMCILSDGKRCPPGQQFVLCANQCPQHCSDLQQGIECQGHTECQPGCRCPEGTKLLSFY